MKLILVRHTAVAVEPGVCYGQTDVPLAESFYDEAEEVKAKLSKYKIDTAYTSPLSRCRLLAEYCGFPDATADVRLMEMNFGEWEMRRYDEISDPRLQLWYDDYLNVAATGGESAMMQRNRFKDFLDSLDVSDEKSIAVFTHGGILIHALAMLKGLTYTEAYSLNLGYGSILEFDLTRQDKEKLQQTPQFD